MTDEQDAIAQAINQELADKHQRVVDAALRVEKVLRGETLAVYVTALSIVLQTVACETPNPQALILVACQKCIDALAHDEQEVMH